MTGTELNALELALWREVRVVDTVEEWLRRVPEVLEQRCGLSSRAMLHASADGTVLAAGQGSAAGLDAWPARVTARLAAAVQAAQGEVAAVLVDEGAIAEALGSRLVVVASGEGQDALVIGFDSAPDAETLTALGRGITGPWQVVRDRQQMTRRIDECESQLSGGGSVRRARALSDAAVIGADQGLSLVMERVRLVAHSDAAVLLLGETGSGKEVIARLIHSSSRRHDGPFIRVNCAAIPPELVDSQLFGHERGAFTGAAHQHVGWFERADRGTLLLDEVGELPLAAQVRLLRVLQDGELERIGGRQTLHVDCRIIASTHRDLPTMVSEGTFREDLWYRLTTFPILIPPLRDRLEDIPDLALHFAKRAAVHYGVRQSSPSAEDIKLLQGYHWPGNIRELASVVNRAVLLGDGCGLRVGESLGISLANSQPAKAPAAVDLRDDPRLESFDTTLRRHLEQILVMVRGRIEGPGGAAEALGLRPSTLRSKLRRLGIDARSFR
jgi:transcriptional regulator with GAF, ATPase, and Fis domain